MINKMLNIKLVAVLCISICTFFSATTFAAEAKKPYVIETLVQGSQEQPNVIYITPWQTNKKAVNVKKSPVNITLPKLAPLHPKNFRKKLSRR